MKCITVINQKGGVGKTTTAANLGVALARRARRVLLIDLDPQAHLTIHLGVEPEGDQPNSYTLLTLQQSIADIRRTVEERLCLVPSHLDLAAAENELVSIIGRETLLQDALDEVGEEYDYAIVDCPPSLGVLTLNGLCAADEVLIPMQAHFLALQGVSKLLETIQLVHSRVNPRIRVSGVLLCMYESSTRLGTEVAQDLQDFFVSSREDNTPWSQARLFRTFIRRNIKLAECPSHGLSVFDYARRSHGAEDYASLADELLALYEGAPATIDTADSCSGAASAAEPATEPARPNEQQSVEQSPQAPGIADDLLVRSSAGVELRSIEEPDEPPSQPPNVDTPPEDEAAVPLAGPELDDFRSDERSVEPARPFARFSDVASPDHDRTAGQADAASASPVDQLRDLCSLREFGNDPSASNESPTGSDAPAGAHAQDPEATDPAREEVEPARSPNQPVPEQCTAELPLVTEMPAVDPHRTEVGDVTDDGELSEPFRPLSMT